MDSIDDGRFTMDLKSYLICKGWFINTSAPTVEPPPGGVSWCEYVMESEYIPK
jgi:hypothetical protein